MDELLEREPKHAAVNIDSMAPISGNTGFPISQRAAQWLPVILSLAGGLLIGAMFGMAAWVSVAVDQTGYAVTFALTGAACSFLPLGIVKLAIWWADAPLRKADEKEHKRQTGI